VPIKGGTFNRPLLKGTILAGGADYQLLQSDGFTQLDARYVLQTYQGNRVYVVNQGIPAAPELQWMNHALFPGVGKRHPGRVVIRFFTVHWRESTAIRAIQPRSA